MISMLTILTLNTSSRYSDDILNLNNIYFDNMVSDTYPPELQLNNVNTFDTEAVFWTCICPFLMIFFLPNLTINVTILIFKLSISHF